MPYAGPVIDVHAHVFFDEEVARSVSNTHVASPQGLIAQIGSERLFRVGAIVMAHKGEPAKTGEQNDRLLAFVKENPKLFAVVSVHPDDGDAAVSELERVAKLGARMLKLHPNTQRFDVASPAVDAIVEKAATHGLPVIFDSTTLLDRAQLGKFVMLAVRHPKAKIILAHMGATDFRELVVLDVLRMYPWFGRNLWIEISGISHIYVDSPYVAELLWVIRKVGIDRVLFGSDFPLVTPLEAVADVERLGFMPEELRKIFYENSKQLLSL